MREVLNVFSGWERACIRDALGEDELESKLDMSVLSEDGIDQSIAEIFSCLAPQTARGFLVSTIMAAMTAGVEEEGLRTEIGTKERACIRDRLADVGVASIVDVLVSESTDPVILNLLGCVPDLIIESILAEAGVALVELTDQQRSCLSDLVADTDWASLGAEAESEGPEVLGLPSRSGRLCSRVHVCGNRGRPIAGARRGCGRRPWRLPPTGHTGHRRRRSGWRDRTTQATRTSSCSRLEQGQLYQIDVTLGTISDSIATLYGPDGAQLVSNDDHADTTASRIYWVARGSGSHYVEVEGWSGDAGTYTVAVVASDRVDDHRGALEGATPVTVGDAAAGEIEHPGGH